MTNSRKFDADGQLFDQVYVESRGHDPRSIPWIQGRPHPLLSSWLEDTSISKAHPGHERALVVGSGLGDDANTLAERGWNVTAFDYSADAVAWAKERFPDAPVSWQVADLFALPDGWHRAFELVVEVHTIQALPVTRRQETIGAIAGTVAENGTLVVVTMTRNIQQPLRGRPWPLTDDELRSIERHDLTETSRTNIPPDSPGQPGRERVIFQRRSA